MAAPNSWDAATLEQLSLEQLTDPSYRDGGLVARWLRQAHCSGGNDGSVLPPAGRIADALFAKASSCFPQTIDLRIWATHRRLSPLLQLTTLQAREAVAAGSGKKADVLSQLEPALASLRLLARPAERGRISELTRVVCYLKLVRTQCGKVLQGGRMCYRGAEHGSTGGPDTPAPTACQLPANRPCPCRRFPMQPQVRGLPDFRIGRCGLVVSLCAPRHSPFHFEVDHRLPVSCGGLTDQANLDAVQWRVNHEKKDRCKVREWVMWEGMQKPSSLACCQRMRPPLQPVPARLPRPSQPPAGLLPGTCTESSCGVH